MADIKISALSLGTTLTGAELFVLVQGGDSKSATQDMISTAVRTWLQSNGFSDSITVKGNTSTIHAQIGVDGSDSFFQIGGGRLGVGTGNPETLVHAKISDVGIAPNGNAVITAEKNGVCNIQLLSSSSYNGGILFGDGDSNISGYIIYSHSTDSMGFQTNGAEKFRISSDGRLSTNAETSPDCDGGGMTFYLGSDLIFATAKNSVTNHGITGYETDTFTQFAAINTNGGVGITGITEQAAGVMLDSYGVNEYISGDIGAISFNAYKGTTPGALSNNAQLFTIRNAATAKIKILGNGDIIPGTDEGPDLGSASYKFNTVYAATGTINTSDATLKTEVIKLTNKEKKAAKEIQAEIGSFQYLKAIDEKGEENARFHIGLTVQKAIEIMENNDLDPFKYGFICYDEWEAVIEPERIENVPIMENYEEQITSIKDVDGKYVQVTETTIKQRQKTEQVPVYTESGDLLFNDGKQVFHTVKLFEEKIIPEKVIREAGGVYGFRYSELAMFIIGAM